MDLQIASRADCAGVRARSLKHQGQVGDQFAAAPEFAGRSYPLEIRM